MNQKTQLTTVLRQLNKEDRLIYALAVILEKELPDLEVVFTDRPVGQRYGGYDSLVYPSYSLEMWVEDFKNLADTSKPLYLWDVEYNCDPNWPGINVYASMTLKV